MFDPKELESEIKKYEDEVAALNKRLAEINDARAQLIRHGMHIEGILGYLRGLANPKDAPGPF